MNTKGRTMYILNGEVHLCGEAAPVDYSNDRFRKEAFTNKYSHSSTKRTVEKYAVVCNGHQEGTTKSWYTDELTQGSFLANDQEVENKLLEMRKKFGV